MKTRLLPQLPDLEIEDEAVSTWNIEDYRDLPTKVRGPKFICGGHPWYESIAKREDSLKRGFDGIIGEYYSFPPATTLTLHHFILSRVGMKVIPRTSHQKDGRPVCNLRWLSGIRTTLRSSCTTVRTLSAACKIQRAYTCAAANHRFNADESDWGFTRFAELRKLFAPQWENKGRPMVEDDAVNITAYVRTYKDPTGVLWHNFVK